MRLNQAVIMVKSIEKNSLREIRESLMMSKAELSRRANISPLTITRIEEGNPCNIKTKRKILLALGFKITDKHKVFHIVESVLSKKP